MRAAGSHTVYGQCSFLAFHISKPYGNNSRVSKEELNKRRRIMSKLLLSFPCTQFNSLIHLRSTAEVSLRLQYASVHRRCQVNFSGTDPIFSPGTCSETNVLFLGEQSSRRNKGVPGAAPRNQITNSTHDCLSFRRFSRNVPDR